MIKIPRFGCDGNGHDIWCAGPGGNATELTDMKVFKNGQEVGWLENVYIGDIIELRGKVHGNAWPCGNFTLEFDAGIFGDWYIGCYEDRLGSGEDWWIGMEWQLPEDLPNGALSLNIKNAGESGDVEHWYITVVRHCDQHYTQYDCEQGQCYWWNGSCHEVPPYCWQLNAKSECLHYGCYWYNGGCHDLPPSCEELNNPADCEDYGCYWYDGSCHTYQKCELIPNQQQCIDAGCWWYMDSCHSEPPPNCEDHQSRQACESWGCYWYNDSCHTYLPSCGQLDNQSDCERYGCYWYDGNCHGFEPECSPEGKQQCFGNDLYECQDGKWVLIESNSPQCMNGNGCAQYNTQSTCESAGCFWYAYPNPMGEPSCHDKQWYEAYLPFIIAGVGIAIIGVALIPSKALKPASSLSSPRGKDG